ncbi:DUF1284 domain-containing protein [Candidatus Desantisbacteria bacterium CG07_land_8_20_14_0_80_39_15]|uniref:DUF1284 domain-containing protein n=1 Tax=Candidatus Desantisbacteria bacterium CG07_land_8_20_14_0_80_39_15 TaxID=1974549 RepID=A0A2M6ZG49_9BACT|nr:MAG: DUF1284 domain-containing protein [Candidatus Desantisbacteria bacterium CG07_land_8_20_14_0_80_39_15]
MKIRAHHLLCVLGFHGLGYNKEFVKKMCDVQRRLKTKPALPIEVLNSCDEICAVCPHQKNNRCKKGEYSYKRVKETDQKVLSALEIKNGDVFSGSEILRLIRKKIGSFPELVKICGMCGWRETCTYYILLRKKWHKTRRA